MRLLLLIICLAALLPAQSIIPGLAAAADRGIPQRIVSLGPINTENVFLLGAGERLVASTAYCVRPEAARKTEKIGSVLQISFEKIISLQPDLVLATGFTKDSQVAMFERAGIRIVRFGQPSSFAESCEQLVKLGKLLGVEQKAQTMVEGLKKEVDAIAGRISTLSLPPPTVLFQIGANPLYVSGRDLFINDFIELIHARNGVGDGRAGRISYERAIGINPDVILIGIMGSETGVAAMEKKHWQRVKSIKAVREGRVHIVDPNLVCSPSPETFVEALKSIVPLIYPQVNALPEKAGKSGEGGT